MIIKCTKRIGLSISIIMFTLIFFSSNSYAETENQAQAEDKPSHEIDSYVRYIPGRSTDAMSSLDSQTEERVIDNLKREFRDSTLIVVSHRFSTVQKMDLVYFFENSSSMEIDTHEGLLERSPRYRELFASQNKKAPEALRKC